MDDTKAVHIQVSDDEAVTYKRTLLEMQLSLLNALEKVITIRELRNEDFKLKVQARKVVRHLISEMRSLSELLPGVELLPIPSEEAVGKVVLEYGKKKLPEEQKGAMVSKRLRLQSELQDIKKRLERLQ